jgi:hypothetical protein
LHTVGNLVMVFATARCSMRTRGRTWHYSVRALRLEAPGAPALGQLASAEQKRLDVRGRTCSGGLSALSRPWEASLARNSPREAERHGFDVDTRECFSGLWAQIRRRELTVNGLASGKELCKSINLAISTKKVQSIVQEFLDGKEPCKSIRPTRSTRKAQFMI